MEKLQVFFSREFAQWVITNPTRTFYWYEPHKMSAINFAKCKHTFKIEVYTRQDELHYILKKRNGEWVKVK